jgi:peptidoglycan-associated lipoprotein
MQRGSIRTKYMFVFGLGAVIFISGCHHRVASAAATPPAAPPAPATPPTVTLSASPGQVTQGDSATLAWSSTNATQLTLSPGPGAVDQQGSRRVSPNASTTYTITAIGNGGRAEASARVTVTNPPVAESQPDLAELFQANVKDAYFDFDKSDIRPQDEESLTRDARFLDAHRQVAVTIEGHCDDRGSEEYNLALGDRRASSTKKYLVSLGIPESRVQTMSYGKERPFCTEDNEGCWQQNRRAHFVMNR